MVGEGPGILAETVPAKPFSEIVDVFRQLRRPALQQAATVSLAMAVRFGCGSG